MEWIWRKFDVFLGAAVIGVAGITASQAHAFLVQYVQRLAHHLDEAKVHLSSVQTGLRYRLMSETVQKELETEAGKQVAALQDRYHAIADANIVTKPFALLLHADQTMLADTWRDFVPALPITADGIFYVVLAMILGLLLYELVKFPVTMLVQEPRRRKFRRRT